MKTNKENQMDDCLIREGKHFPNGFRSWVKTHYEIVGLIASTISIWEANDCPMEKSKTLELSDGHPVSDIHDYAEKLTDEFEKQNEGRKWSGEYYESLTEFFHSKDKE